MSITLLFLVGAPRSGTTMLERILSSHSQIQGGPEPHLLTPLAHLGIWSNVDKAPYDHIVAGIGQKDFVAQLPDKEQDYYAACRAYCEHLYERYMAGSGKRVCLDKTPEYATILPFISKVLPDAKYVVLTRHPVAVFSSFATSFFDGDYDIAHAHDPLLERYVPAMAAFLRQREVPFLHVRYEDFVADPEPMLRSIYEYVGLPHEPQTLDYNKNGASHSGLGDPIGIKQHSRPSVQSLSRWTDELIDNPHRLELMRRIVASLDPDDLETLGYPVETFWRALEEREAGGGKVANGHKKRPKRLDRYALERKAIVRGRSLVQGSSGLRDLIKKVRLACDVLLREY